MSEKTVVDELKAALKLEPKEGESPEAFAKKLALKGNNITDDDWQGLSQAAQLWVNAGLDAIEKRKVVPLPAGLDPTPPPPPKPDKAKAFKKLTKQKKAAGQPTGLGPKGKFSRADKIKVVSKDNPFRAGTKCHVWFGRIKAGMTVDEAINAEVPRHHIRWAHTLGHLEIGG